MPGTVATFLGSTHLFADLEADELEAVAVICRKRPVPKGSILFYEEDPGNACYVVTQGKIKIVINSGDGREHILGILGPHDLLGEMSLIDGKPRSASAVAVEDSEVLTLPRDEFGKLLRQVPDIVYKLLVVLSRRLRATDAHVESLAFLSAPGRVARLMLHLADESGERSPEGKPRFTTRMTRQEMANITGTSRETFTRIMTEYQERLLLSVDRQHFVIENPSKLRELIV